MKPTKRSLPKAKVQGYNIKLQSANLKRLRAFGKPVNRSTKNGTKTS